MKARKWLFVAVGLAAVLSAPHTSQASLGPDAATITNPYNTIQCLGGLLAQGGPSGAVSCSTAVAQFFALKVFLPSGALNVPATQALRAAYINVAGASSMVGIGPNQIIAAFGGMPNIPAF